MNNKGQFLDPASIVLGLVGGFIAFILAARMDLHIVTRIFYFIVSTVACVIVVNIVRAVYD